MPKRNRIVEADNVDLPTIATNATIPVTPTPLGQLVGGSHTSEQYLQALSTPPSPGLSSQAARQKIEEILKRNGKSFCEELGIDLIHGGADALWQWLCASVLISSRIKSNAGVTAAKALLQANLNSPQAMAQNSREIFQEILRTNGFEFSMSLYTDTKTTDSLVHDALAILSDYNGDLNNLREAAGHTPKVERSMLKKLRGIGDGGVDVFFREAQLIWDELFPFSDKKALKAARLVGLWEHPESLAQLVNYDKCTYVRLISALVRIELSKSYNEY